ncbi:DgyrCDS2742 [Dimorphilus gyrociliatus]|uniref:DgyrCDS2742 n=1 Tax=Dimorphilus gyrociliatus TaxID=2664684 RepID=A0A7I8VGA6_9ANNE|nr:DgyrCDS2742 [Dimorphilus gyrociliatus]
MATSRLKQLSSLRRFINNSANIKSDKKGKRIEKIKNYFMTIMDDYRTAVVETGQDMKKKPLKSGIYLTILGSLLYMGKNNPSMTDFEENLIINTNELLQVGDPIRNPTSNNHMQRISGLRNEGVLKRTSFGIFSIVWYDNYDPIVDVYEARCKHLKVGWVELFRERVIDIGFLNKWWWIQKAMEDYDINPEEWGENAS